MRFFAKPRGDTGSPDRDILRRRYKRSRRQEERIAETYAGRRQPGSGSFPARPQDVSTGAFLIQAKTTEKERFGVRKDVLGKLERDAVLRGKMPVLVLEFVTRYAADSYVVLRENDFLDLLGSRKFLLPRPGE